MNPSEPIEPIVARHWLVLAAPKAAPVLSTSTVLALARIWNAGGAEHDVGGAVLMTALAAGSAAAGVLAAHKLGDTTVTVTCLSGSAACALAGIAAYSDGIELPLLLWAIATLIMYALAARTWRSDRREAAARQRHTSERREHHAHVERVEAIRAGAQIESARAGAAYAEALSHAILTRAAQPGFNPAALHSAGLPELPNPDH
ncbi:hypothetical protein ACX6XY_17760 [Streptomyces sp. O3]